MVLGARAQRQRDDRPTAVSGTAVDKRFPFEHDTLIAPTLPPTSSTPPIRKTCSMRYRLLIVIATVIWGSSFVIVKDMTGYISPAWILFIRFSIATAILSLSFVKYRELYFKRTNALYGIGIGAALFLGYYFQTLGITDTTPGKNAFLTATYCVIVPFSAWLLMRRRPNRFNAIAAVLGIAGIGLISLDGGFGIGFGDAMTLVSAVFYALHITLVSKFAKERSIYVLTIWQFFAVALCSLIVALALEAPPDFSSFPAEAWPSILYLSVIVTALALLFQNIGQAHLPPASAALLLSLESVFGVLFSIALGAEALTLQVAGGFVLVFAAIVVSEAFPELFRKRQERHERQERIAAEAQTRSEG